MPYSLKTLQNLKKSIEDKEQFLPFEFLGRSLAYNPYMPRADVFDFKRDKNSLVAEKILISPPLTYEKLECLVGCEGKAIVLDFAPLYEEGIPSAEVLDAITHLRRYSEKFILHNDIFSSPYQLLESVVYGSDGVILEAGFLGANLGEMCDFTSRLGLVPIVKITSSEELKMAILAKAEILYIAQDFSNLLTLVPQSKIIFCDAPQGLILDEKNSYGVDIFLMRDNA